MATISLNKEQFFKKVGEKASGSSVFEFLGRKPAVIDFYAEWCQPCRMVAPVIEELSETFDGKVDFYKVNVDEENELSALFDIRSIPTLLFVTAGGEVRRYTGAVPRARLKELVLELFE